MTEETNREPEMGLTFEKVWAMFQETDRKMQEIDRVLEETARIVRENAVQIKETDLQMKETDRQLKETGRNISKLGGRFGELVEHLVAPNLLEKFNARGFNFGRAGPNVIFKDPQGAFITEVDILLENGDTALAVEVKAKLTIPDVREHIARMEKLRRYADEHGDKRRFVGAVAGAIIPKEVKPFAIKSGFYVVEQAGDTVKIDVPEGFMPKQW
jgi:hypothetical protein